MSVAGLDRYKSASQRARVATESWAETNLYCPNCTSPKLARSAANTPAVDYTCPRCDSPFQLKSQARAFSQRITDASYQAMRRAIEEDKTPNLFALHYECLREGSPSARKLVVRDGWVATSCLPTYLPMQRFHLLLTGSSKVHLGYGSNTLGSDRWHRSVPRSADGRSMSSMSFGRSGRKNSLWQRSTLLKSNLPNFIRLTASCATKSANNSSG